MKLALFVATTMFCAAAPAQDKPAATVMMKIGYVNTERILREAAPAVRAQKKIEAEFKKRDDELARNAEQLKRLQDELDKNSVTMSESVRRTKEREFGELNRDFQRKQREFREDLNSRRNEELAQVVDTDVRQALPRLTFGSAHKSTRLTRFVRTVEDLDKAASEGRVGPARRR